MAGTVYGTAVLLGDIKCEIFADKAHRQEFSISGPNVYSVQIVYGLLGLCIFISDYICFCVNHTYICMHTHMTNNTFLFL